MFSSFLAMRAIDHHVAQNAGFGQTEWVCLVRFGFVGKRRYRLFSPLETTFESGANTRI
jgi:hypothetical protein